MESKSGDSVSFKHQAQAETLIGRTKLPSPILMLPEGRGQLSSDPCLRRPLLANKHLFIFLLLRPPWGEAVFEREIIATLKH